MKPYRDLYHHAHECESCGYCGPPKVKYVSGKIRFGTSFQTSSTLDVDPYLLIICPSCGYDYAMQPKSAQK